MEQPRPQPKASYTLLYLMLLASFSQLIGQFLDPIEPDSEERPARVVQHKTYRASLGQLLRWTPESAEAFLPRLFRSSEGSTEEMQVEELDDELLISDLDLKTEEDPEVDQGEQVASSQDERSGLDLEISFLDLERHQAIHPQIAEAERREQVRRSSEEPSTPTYQLDQEDNPEIPSGPKPKKPQRRRAKSGVILYSIEDPSNTMISFYNKLREAKSGRRKVKVAHFGDSLIAGDYVTRTARRLLQKTFGDGGHGYFLPGKGSPWYGRQWISLKSKGKWTKDRYTRPKLEDRIYGLGGVVFTSSSKGSWIQAKATGTSLGGKVDQVEVHYVAQPQGGRFEFTIGAQTREVSTQSESKEIRTLIVKVDPEAESVGRVTILGDGEVRLLGLVFENAKGGVVYDALGIEGARARSLLSINRSAWTTQLRQRNPDLVILNYGTNESEQSDLKIEGYKKSLLRVITRFKVALPETPCLIMSPMDRGIKDEKSGEIKSRRIVSRIVSAQRQVALEAGCAFWSTYEAMGGKDSMARWYRSNPKLAGGDLTHPTGMGANRIGAMLYTALMEGYRKGGGS